MSRDDLVRLVMSWRNTRAKMTRAQQAASPLPAVDDAWRDDLARCAWVLVRAYRGAHHVPRVRVGDRWLETNHCGDLSTADGDLLTRLVVLAHDAAVRVEISSSGPYMGKVMLHPRRPGQGDRERPAHGADHIVSASPYEPGRDQPPDARGGRGARARR